MNSKELLKLPRAQLTITRRQKPWVCNARRHSSLVSSTSCDRSLRRTCQSIYPSSTRKQPDASPRCIRSYSQTTSTWANRSRAPKPPKAYEEEVDEDDDLVDEDELIDEDEEARAFISRLGTMTPEELDSLQGELLRYEEALVLRKPAKPQPTPFVPETFTAESLITNRIATASAAVPASQATVLAAIARLSRRDDTSYSYDDELARRLAHGKQLVRFGSRDERARIVALAEEHARDTTRKRNVRKLRKLRDGEEMEYESPLPVLFASIPKKNRRELVDKVLKGKYSYGDPKAKDKSQFDLKKAIDLNGTFTPRGSGGFLGIMKKFLPQSSKT